MLFAALIFSVAATVLACGEEPQSDDDRPRPASWQVVDAVLLDFRKVISSKAEQAAIKLLPREALPRGYRPPANLKARLLERSARLDGTFASQIDMIAVKNKTATAPMATMQKQLRRVSGPVYGSESSCRS